MIVVKVELWPYGDEAKKKVIAQSRIWNTLIRSLEGKHMYGYDIETDGNKEDQERDVMHHRSAGIWELIRTVLNDRHHREKA